MFMDYPCLKKKAATCTNLSEILTMQRIKMTVTKSLLFLPDGL